MDAHRTEESHMLHGTLVTLRPIEREDLKALQQLERNVDLVVLAEGHWQPSSLAHRERSFDKQLEREEVTGFVIAAEDRVIGSAGLHYISRRDATAQVGIRILDPTFLGRGYGRDALMLLLDWSFRIQNYRRLWLETLGTNERAIRAYRACGFVEEGRWREHYYFDGAYVDGVTMGLLRSEWEAHHVAARSEGSEAQTSGHLPEERSKEVE
jgi:diamine N-acetyltransferase